jgi:RNA exonuclease 1
MVPFLYVFLFLLPVLLIMASGLGMLKHLPCPAGKSCTAFQCLFKHEGEDKSDEVAKEPDQPSADKKKSPTSEGDGSPRKRLKLDAGSSHDQEAPSQQPASQPLDKPPTTATGGVNHHIETVSNMPEINTETNSILTNQKPPPPTQRTPKIAAVSTAYHTATPPASSVKLSVASPAQVPPKAAPKKPETLTPRHLKIPPAKYDIRWRLIKFLHEQYTRLNNELRKAIKDDETALVMSDQELIVRTLDEEESIAIKKTPIYGNVLKNRITSYKKMLVAQWKEERTEAVKKARGEVNTPAKAHQLIDTGLSPIQEVDFLHRLSSDLKGLERYGYIATVPKDEDIEKAKQAVEASGNIEICDRCTRRFTVFPGRREEDGALTSGGPCLHHPGKAYFLDRAPGDKSVSPKKWRCCQQLVGDTDGCTTGKDHVFKITDPSRLGSILQFAETPANPNAPIDRAVGFDCEMGYTVYGLELIRLTAVSWPSGDELLDILVYPVGEHIDLNTRFSGVRPEDMAGAKRWKPGDDASPTIIPSTDPSIPPQRKLKLVHSPKAARDLLFSLISPDTPLIGHGLENDLNSMRIVHPVIVDTVLLFPHKRGLPIRNGLKWLMEAMLDRKIQMNTEDDEKQGHDSAEDARAAGELVRLKVKDEWRKMQMQGWTIGEDGSLQPPDSSWTVIDGKKGKKVGV